MVRLLREELFFAAALSKFSSLDLLPRANFGGGAKVLYSPVNFTIVLAFSENHNKNDLEQK